MRRYKVDSKLLQNAARKACWLGVGLIAVASLLPGSDRPDIGAPGQVQHLLAYCLASLVFFYGRDGRNMTGYILGFCAYAGVLEFLQQFIPGRTPRLSDVAASAAGVALGVALATVARSIGASADSAPRASEPARAKTGSLSQLTEKRWDME